MIVPKEVERVRKTYIRGGKILARLGYQDFVVDIING